jgi:protein-S-isoprenylcysteine O-methyltransferase Ste14
VIKGIPLSIVLTFIVLAFYVMDFYYMSRYDPENRQGKKGWSWDYTLFTVAVALVILIQPIIAPSLAWSVDSVWGLAIQIAGGLMVITSFALHIWARRHLRKFYVERVEVQSDHQLIDSGPYRFVRHPIITSFFALTGGLLLVNLAITTGLVFIYTIWDFTRSARREEELLSNTVPGYRDYMSRTSRFLPRLWRNP